MINKDKSKDEIEKLKSDYNLKFSYIVDTNYLDKVNIPFSNFLFILLNINKNQTFIFASNNGQRLHHINGDDNYNPKYDNSIYFENEYSGDFLRIAIIDDNGHYLNSEDILKLIRIGKRISIIDKLLDT